MYIAISALILCIGAVWLLKRDGSKQPISSANAVLESDQADPLPPDEENGDLSLFQARLDQLSDREIENFFVVASVVDGPEFIQISARRENLEYIYEIDLPETTWSAPYIAAVTGLAKTRDFEVTVLENEGPIPRFHDFTTNSLPAAVKLSEDIMMDIFGKTRDMPFKVAWGFQ